MRHWIRQLFRSTPTAPIVKPQRARLGLTPLEDRTTPSTLRVNSSLDNLIAGNGQVTLREAIIAANNNSTTDLGDTGASDDTIIFVGSAVGSTISLTIDSGSYNTGLPPITGSVKIIGTEVTPETITRTPGSGDFRFIGVPRGGDVSISNLRITNPNPDSATSLGAGGIWCSFGGTLRVDRVLFEKNIGNERTVGGAISNSGRLFVSRSAFIENSAVQGGAIFTQNEVQNESRITDCLFAYNRASRQGGAVMCVGSTVDYVNTTFSNNTASTGGAIYAAFSIVLTNCTITQNISTTTPSTYVGGGILTTNTGTYIFSNNTIISNNHSIDSSSNDVTGLFDPTSSHNIIGDAGSAGGLTNGNNGNQVGVDPLLQPLANNGGRTKTHALGQNSPALGKGSASVAGYSVYDQRGAARDNGTPDIGAYEVNHPLATVGAPTTLAGLFQPKPSATANEAFVKGLYQSTLLRAPDTAGLNGWLTLLNGGTSRSTVANGFVNSTENRRNQVTFFYRYFLSREPDTAGLNGWVSQLQGGTDEGTVMTGFILSNEFSGLNTNSQFVNLMYYALLSRQADAAGFNGWVNAVNGGMSRGTVVNAFLRSDEGLNRVVNSMFQTYLKRYGSTGDLGAFRSYLNTNTFGQAATLMLSSAEFFTNAGNNLI